MLKFSERILESRKVNIELTRGEMEEYVTKVKLPKEIKLVCNFMLSNDILDRQSTDILITGNRTQLGTLVTNFNVTLNDLLDVQKLLKVKPENQRLIPTLQNPDETEGLINGTKTVEDITLDLETEKGRARTAKLYMSLVMSIANKYRGSGLDWNGLVSAGMLGLTNAMRDYRTPDYYSNLESNEAEAKKYKKLTFKQYASWRIKQKILNDINEFSRTVRINQYQYEKNRDAGNTQGNFNSVSIDQHTQDDEDRGLAIDRMIGVSSASDENKFELSDTMKQLKKLLEKNFSQRDCTIFYKVFGLFGYDDMKQKEIAKEIGVTPALVNIITKKIISYLQTAPGAKKYLQELYNHHFESLMVQNFDKSREEIMDAFINDDIHVLLETILQLDSKVDFNNKIGSVLENYNDQIRNFLIECLEKDFDFIDENYKTSKHIYTDFLENIYPTERLKNSTDVDILNHMATISDKFKEHNF